MPHLLAIDSGHPGLQGELSETVLTISDILDKYKHNKIDILHMDIQGSEVAVLREIYLKKLPVRYMFISIHWNENDNVGETDIYSNCKDIINKLNAEYIFDDRTQGGNGDGLIICKI